MEDYINSLLDQWRGHALPWLFIYIVVFSLLARWMACNPKQPYIREGLLTDVLYYLFSPTIYNVFRVWLLGVGFYVIFSSESPEQLQHYMMNGYGPLSKMPLWLQAAIIFLISDFLLYWIHRWFHRPLMWKFHAIHHSPTHVDWLSTFRFHPVNMWLAFAVVDTIMMLVGFSPASIGVLALFNALYSPMVHANLNWTFGPFKYCFASPVFHRWHHTSQAEGMDKNFAPTFPVIDIMFGTFYMPEGKVPEYFGVPGADIPNNFFGQMLWPFQRDKSNR